MTFYDLEGTYQLPPQKLLNSPLFPILYRLWVGRSQVGFCVAYANVVAISYAARTGPPSLESMSAATLSPYTHTHIRIAKVQYYHNSSCMSQIVKRGVKVQYVLNPEAVTNPERERE